MEKVEKDNENDLFLITTLTSTSESTTTTTTTINKKENNNQEGDNNFNKKARARYVIIATGIQHLTPDIMNFEEYDGNGTWHCPHCDGFQATNKKLVIVASDNKNNKALDYAKVFLGWT
ncbi:MAG: hypothetical protein ABJB73_09465, partial [Candidatus Nitrosocosmicus sp.]